MTTALRTKLTFRCFSGEWFYQVSTSPGEQWIPAQRDYLVYLGGNIDPEEVDLHIEPDQDGEAARLAESIQARRQLLERLPEIRDRIVFRAIDRNEGDKA